MDLMQFVEIVASVGLVAVTLALFIATNMYRKATEQMEKIQKKSLEVQQHDVEVQQHDVEVQRQSLDFLKKEHSLKLIDSWNHPALLEARRLMRELDKESEDISVTELLEKIENDNGPGGLEESVIRVFNYWDRVRLAVAPGGVDEEILKDAFADIFVAMYRQFTPWLDTRKNPKYKADLKILFDRWESASSQ